MRFSKLKVFMVMVLTPAMLAIFSPAFAAGKEILKFEVPKTVEEFKEKMDFEECQKLHKERLEIGKIHDKMCMGPEGNSFKRFIHLLQDNMGADSARGCDLISREVKDSTSLNDVIMKGTTFEKIAKKMDSFFSRVPLNDKMISVYSNVEKSVVRQAEISKLKPGDEYKDKDFICANVVSTSYHNGGVLTRPRYESDEYSRKKFAPDESIAIACKINVPKGAILADMDVIGYRERGEGLVVIPRNTTFKVRSVREITKNFIDCFSRDIPEKTTKIKIIELDIIAQERPDFIEPKQKVSYETAQDSQREDWEHIHAQLQSSEKQTGESDPKLPDLKTPLVRYYKYLAKRHAILATPEERYNFGVYTDSYGSFDTEKMNNFFKRVPETAEKLTVYRVISQKDLDDVLKLKPGEIYESKKAGRNFLSTTIDPGFAYYYAMSDLKNTHRPAMLKINIPKGKKIVAVDNMGSRLMVQHEMVLRSCEKFRIEKIERFKNFAIIEVTMV